MVSELFMPADDDNVKTNQLVTEMAKIAATCWQSEFLDENKATSDYLSCAEGKYSWANTSAEEHEGLLAAFATNDLAEQPFGALTQQLTQYGTQSLVDLVLQQQHKQE